MSTPAPARHGNECRCSACKAMLKQQYHAQGEHWATRLPPTPIDQIGPMLERSNRLVQPLKEQIDELKYVLLAILHASPQMQLDLESETWGDEIRASDMRKLKALADTDQERKAAR